MHSFDEMRVYLSGKEVLKLCKEGVFFFDHFG